MKYLPRLLVVASFGLAAMAVPLEAVQAQQPGSIIKDAASELRAVLARVTQAALGTPNIFGPALQQAVEDALESAISSAGVDPTVALKALDGLVSSKPEGAAAIERVRARIRQAVAAPLRPRAFGGVLTISSADLGPTGGGGSDYRAP